MLDTKGINYGELILFPFLSPFSRWIEKIEDLREAPRIDLRDFLSHISRYIDGDSEIEVGGYYGGRNRKNIFSEIEKGLI